ncbi:armadillo repeat-containing protein 7 isoform X2 [Cephus cinctus]|uniref:Armadillo repeat-containing protein 7 isoform X2 n=1 Tax=Cephus cinctus TaxID=211228 RepID=A0AAJ7FU45_CEPCN|nr:armadillo repeat-containing protein 7 isoform X2 [Cephus cinctus]
MFSRKQQLIDRTGKDGVGRYDFLRLLVVEFNTTKSQEAKEQVLANLANFAYDPVNYEYIRQLHIIDLFFAVITENNITLIRFAIGGICNLCLDPENKAYIIRNNGVASILTLLSSSDEETVLSTITTLIFLITPASKSEITSKNVIECMTRISESAGSTRLRNLATVFLNDYCKENELSESTEKAHIIT